MKSLKSQLKKAINNNKTKSENAIKHIQEQTYDLTTDSDYLTIKRKPRKSRRKEALKVIEAAKSGKINKIDEDQIYQQHEISKAQDEGFEISQDEFEKLDAKERMIALSKLMGNNSNDYENEDETNINTEPEEINEEINFNIQSDIDTDLDDSINIEESFDNSNSFSENSAPAENKKNLKELQNDKKYNLIHKKIILYKKELNYYNDQYKEDFKGKTEDLTFWEKVRSKISKYMGI